MIDRRTYTVAETARILGISRTSAYEDIRRGELPHFRVGRRILVGRADLGRFMHEDLSSALMPRTYAE